MEVLAKEMMEKLQKQLTPEIMGALAVSLVTGALLMFLLLRSQVVSLKKSLENQQVNPGVDKENPKVVHTCKVADMEDTDKLVYCRCWRSKKFPYCDGSHVSFNKCSKDNVGPLIVQK